MGIGASKPRDKDTKLKDRSDADDNDNDNDLDRRGVVVAPNGNVYASSLHLLGASEQAQVGAVVQSEAADLNAVGAAQTANASVATGAGLHSAPPSTKAKAAKITLLLMGGGAIGAGITTALFLAGVIKAAANTVVVTVPVPVQNPPPVNPPPTPAAPGEAQYTKAVQSFAKLPEADFWSACKTVIDQFEAGLEVQKLVAAYIVKITTPNYFDDQGTKEFGTKPNYMTAAKAIVAKIMDPKSKDALLAYDLVAATAKADLLLGRPSLEAQPNVVRTLRAGLLIVVLDELIAANK